MLFPIRQLSATPTTQDHPPPSPGLGMLIAGGIVFWVLFILWYEQLPQLLYAHDRSHICRAITVLFMFMLVHCIICSVRVSRQAAQTTRVEQLLDSVPGTLHRTGNQWLLGNDQPLPSCPALQLIASTNWNKDHYIRPDSTALRDFLNTIIGQGNRLGWFCSDLMIKLGLLGTVIGFILMLASITNVEDLDISTMQVVMHEMGTGMATALYTTLAGLGCGMTLGMLYYILDDYADSVIDRNRRLLELRLPSLITD